MQIIALDQVSALVPVCWFVVDFLGFPAQTHGSAVGFSIQSSLR
jgi:hypothetical protein